MHSSLRTLMIVAVGVSSLLFGRVSSSCSIAVKPFEAVREEEFVFYGEVVGYSSTAIPFCRAADDRDCSKAWGLLVKVVEPIHLPKGSTPLIEVYEFGLGADCSSLPSSERRVRTVAVGTPVQVLGRALREKPETIDAGKSKIDVSDWGGGSILPISRTKSLRKLTNHKHDYSCFFSYMNEAKGREFELRKDLWRLESAKSQASSAEIIARIARCGQYSNELHSPEASSFIGRLVAKHLRDQRYVELVDREVRRARYNSSSDEVDRAVELEFANLGDPMFQVLLGERYEDEDKVEQAIQWYERAAGAGYLPARLYLFRMFTELSEQDDDPAIGRAFKRKANRELNFIMRKANTLSDRDASTMFVLADLYWRGIGDVAEDRKLAASWACKAMASDPKKAHPRISWIEFEKFSYPEECDPKNFGEDSAQTGVR
jgi:hypothetical protein